MTAQTQNSSLPRTSLWRALFVLTVGFTAPAVLGTWAQAQTFNDIFDFSLQAGWSPYSGVTRDNAGNLYGTTNGALVDAGTVYELKRSHGGWILHVLFSFNPLSASSEVVGWAPYSGVVFGPDGALYGTTVGGGVGGGSNGYGVVYKLMPPATVCESVSCPWTETVLYEFQGHNDGSAPEYGNVVFDRAGNLYGTTTAGGGTGCQGSGCGTVYKLSPSGSGWTEQVLYRFAGGTDGAGPTSAVVLDAAGNLYGTTTAGGSAACSGGCGTVYELSPSGSGWTERLLYTFQNGSDGESPFAGLTFDQSGNLYGATFTGGSAGGGTVFQLSPHGQDWSFSTLYSFTPGGYGPYGPLENLAIDAAGSLYGTTYLDGGTDGAGSVFKLAPHNGEWTFTTLFTFPAGGLGDPYGQNPIGGPTVDSFGNIYGTTSEGGTQSCEFEIQCGVVWEITP